MSERTGSKRSCLVYGCLGAVVVMIVAAVALYFGAKYAVNQVVNRFTDEQPMELPQSSLTAPEQAALDERIKGFADALTAGQEAEPLTLSAAEANAFLASHPDMAKFKDRIHVSFEDDEVRGQISVPLRDFGLQRLSEDLADRYLNAAGNFTVSLNQGNLVIRAKSLEVKGEPLPESVMAEFRKENLAKEVRDDPQANNFLSKLESIEVEDGQLIITPKPAEDRSGSGQ